MRLVAQGTPDMGSFALDLAVRSDAVEEEELLGLRSVVARTLLAGVEGIPTEEINTLLQALDDEGGGQSGRANDEFVEITATGPGTRMSEILGLIRTAVTEATFPDEAVQTEVGAARVFLQTVGDDEDLERTVRGVLFPVPQAGRQFGTDATLALIQPEDVRALAGRLFQPERMILALVGPAASSELLDEAEALFGDIPSGGGPLPEFPDWAKEIADLEARERHMVWDMEQEVGRLAEDHSPPLLPLPYRSIVREVEGVPVARFMLGFEIPPIGTPDWAVAEVVAALLDPTAEGRLGLEPALAHEPDASFAPTGAACSAARAVAHNHMVILAYARGLRGPGFQAMDWVRTLPTQSIAALEAVNSALASLTADPPTDEELQRAKRNVLGESRMRLETARERAQYLAITLQAGMSPDASAVFEAGVRATTAEDVQRFVATYLTPDHRAMVLFIPRAERADDYTNFPFL